MQLAKAISFDSVIFIEKRRVANRLWSKVNFCGQIYFIHGRRAQGPHAAPAPFVRVPAAWWRAPSGFGAVVAALPEPWNGQKSRRAGQRDRHEAWRDRHKAARPACVAAWVWRPSGAPRRRRNGRTAGP